MAIPQPCQGIKLRLKSITCAHHPITWSILSLVEGRSGVRLLKHWNNKGPDH